MTCIALGFFVVPLALLFLAPALLMRDVDESARRSVSAAWRARVPIVFAPWLVAILVYTSFAAMPWESIFGERIDRAEVVTLIWIHSCAHLFGVVLCGIVFFVLWKLAPPLPRNAKLFALALAMFAMTATGSLLVIPILGLALM